MPADEMRVWLVEARRRMAARQNRLSIAATTPHMEDKARRQYFDALDDAQTTEEEKERKRQEAIERLRSKIPQRRLKGTKK